MLKRWVEYVKILFVKIAAILTFFTLWEVVPRLGLVDRMYIPPFSEVISAWGKITFSGELFVHIAASLQRSMGGLLLAVVIAIPLGLLVGWFGKFERVLDPLLQMFRNIPTLSLLPVFIIFFGLGEVSKIALIFWGTVWPILVNTISGVRNVEPLIVKSARSMGVNNLTLFWKVVLPSAAPSIITGFRLSATISILILVAAEMLGANQGLGFLIKYSEEKYDIPEMFAGIITISLLGFIVNYIIVSFEKRITGWKEQVGQQ